MIPSVTVVKSTVGGSPALNSTQGILAVIASAQTGSSLPPTMLTNQGLTTSTFGAGMLSECAVYNTNVSGLPCVGLAVVPTIPGSYYAGTFVKNVGGSCVVTTTGAPYLHYDVQIVIITGGTIGVAGITYTWTVDGGDTVSGVTALGTNTTLTIPNTGVSFGVPSGTLLAGDNWSVFTERPLMNNSDLATYLPVLGMTKLPWEGVLLDAAYGTGTVAVVDEFLGARESQGQFNFALLNTRFLLEPTPTAEAPSVYATAITAQTSTDASNRLCVCADGGHLTSLITGFTTKFPTSLALAAQTMAVTPNIGTDPAFVGLGPLEGFEISANGNPNDWDEFLYQSLDSQRLVTMRTFATGGPVGAFITNANVLVSTGSSITWLQLLRVLNKGCGIAWQVLNTVLSKGVQVVFNQTLGYNVIKETAAQTLEHLVNDPLQGGLSGQVSAVSFNVNRSDNLDAPFAPVNCSLGIVPDFYLKNIRVTAALVKQISAPNGGV